MRALVGLAMLACGLALPGVAAAHIGLRYPPSRYGDSVLKQGPCGLAGGARSDNVTVLEPGATIDVQWDEYVNHPGHFRIAFDVDGDDDFVDPLCLSGCNTVTPEIATYSNQTVLLDDIPDVDGGLTGATVTLPDVECERCTLQVIQVMYDKPPYTLPGNDIYYQCADLVLRRSTPPGCPGDCDGDGQVSVAELVVGVEMSLGTDPLDACDGLDADASGTVSIDELIRALTAALDGCPR